MDVHGYWLGHLWLFIPVVTHLLTGSAAGCLPFFFVGMPLIDRLLGHDNATVVYTTAQQRYLQAVLLSYPLSHLAAIAATLAVLALTPVTLLQAIFLSFGTALTLAGQGNSIAHELGHSVSRWGRMGARIVLATSGYGHFQIAHVRQHHVWVGTPKDPVSAPRGMTFYQFMIPAFRHEYAGAWKSELARLKNKQLSIGSWHNEMLMTTLATITVGTLCVGVAGGYGAMFFAAVVANAYFILLGVNYIEHYGLSRQQNAEGKYEKVIAKHTWNAPYRLTGWTWFNLQRHPDHHMHGSRKFFQLESIAESPVLPSSYVGLLGAILVPPLWFKLVHPILDSMESTARVTSGPVTAAE
jgi:alkane 1-monooxygenase